MGEYRLDCSGSIGACGHQLRRGGRFDGMRRGIRRYGRYGAVMVLMLAEQVH